MNDLNEIVNASDSDEEIKIKLRTLNLDNLHKIALALESNFAFLKRLIPLIKEVYLEDKN